MSNFVGQLLITGISGTELTEKEKEFIEKENIGGVILFSKNFESPAQLAELVNSIQKLRDEYPLFISVDHEGGSVTRFKNYFTQFPAMMDVSKLASPKICFHIHKIMAEELSTCGINLNFSPCCDVLTNPNSKVIKSRAFGTTPDDVSKFISAAIRGLQTNNIMACAKHFPGHGMTTKDSHHELPISNVKEEDFRTLHLPPFLKAIKSSRVEFIMMSHIIVDCIDQTLPSSLSGKTHKIVRDELKFNKIIISDDLQMGALADNFSQKEIITKSLTAGTDILLYRDMDKAESALEIIKSEMKTKTLKNELIADKVKRITNCKKTHLSEYRPIYIPHISNKINTRATQIFLEEISQKISALQG